VLQTYGFETQYKSDGANPQAPLVDIGNTLYGTTTNGGGSDDAGTVFSIPLLYASGVRHRGFKAILP
jgi:uncharacterized repeat protein (TIGR03803 family)